MEGSLVVGNVLTNKSQTYGFDAQTEQYVDMLEAGIVDDDNPAAAQRSSPVAKAKVSPAARRKAARKRTEDGQPVHSFRTLLQDLANLTRNSVRFGDAHPTTILARPTPSQTRAFELLTLKIAA